MRYRFADLTLDIDRSALEQAGQAVKIRPKVFDVLVYLIEHHERLVSKNELLQKLWPRRYVSESTLSTCLKELRQAVGDSGRRQRVIQTLPKRGYRFIAPFEIRDSRQANGDAVVKTLAENMPSEQRIATANGSNRRALTPFVGRNQELALLTERY